MGPHRDERRRFRGYLVGAVFGFAKEGGCENEPALRKLTGRASTGLLGVGLRLEDWQPWELDFDYLKSQFDGPGGKTRAGRLHSCISQLLGEKPPGKSQKRVLKKLFVILERDLYLPRVDSLLLRARKVPSALQTSPANLAKILKKEHEALAETEDPHKRRRLLASIRETEGAINDTYFELQDEALEALAKAWDIPISFSKGGFVAKNLYDASKGVDASTELYFAFLRLTENIHVLASPNKQNARRSRIQARTLADELVNTYLPRPWFGLKEPKRSSRCNRHARRHLPPCSNGFADSHASTRWRRTTPKTI